MPSSSREFASGRWHDGSDADVAVSLADGRLFPQAAKLARCPQRPLILLEGPRPARMPDVHPHALKGAMVSLAVMWQAMIVLPRLAAAALAHAASVMPVTVVTGARQTGKSTLVRDLVPPGDRPYFTLDDLDVLEQASDAPDDLVARAEQLTLDEVRWFEDILVLAHLITGDLKTAGVNEDSAPDS